MKSKTKANFSHIVGIIIVTGIVIAAFIIAAFYATRS
jgi:hypothetical protein